MERYFAICQFWKVKPVSKTISCILVIIWCVSCLISIPHIVYMAEFITFPESLTSLLTYCKIEMDEDHYLGYNMLKITMLYVLPVLIMTFTYSVISRHLWKNELPGVSEEGNVLYTLISSIQFISYYPPICPNSFKLLIQYYFYNCAKANTRFGGHLTEARRTDKVTNYTYY